ncbi:MAG: hypothetical protein QNJ98_20685, partial [Planctomycetota bacterium]|nr:hypothetical protein [Planctomycetota bacterium]
MVRAFALSLVVLLVGCGTEPIAAPGGAAPVAAAAAGGAALPVAGPSWVAGDRASPTGGRITVGLLVNAREARRLATLIPKNKLRAFMQRRYPRVEEPEDPVVIEWDDWGAKFRTWGPQGLHLANVRAWFRKHHDLDVEFREVLASECEGLPAVVAEQTPVGAHERKALKAYKDAGGRLLVPNELLFPKAGVRKDEGLRTALEDVIATSPFVHALDADPFAVEARREGDTVVVDFPVAHTKAVLKDAAGRLLTSGLHSGTHDRVHLEAPDPELDPFTHFVVLTHEHDGHSIERAVAVADLVGTLERQVEAPNQVHAGGVLALRIRTSLSHDASPVPGQTGTVALKVSDRIVASTTYTSDANGFAHPRLEVPQRLPSRRATLVIDDVEQTIQITRGWRVSVVTERPLYKQTDKVHVRAMVHRAGDGRPVRNASVELAIGDMKRIVTTSAHGIASHTFELVDHKVGKAAVVARAGDAKTACRF